MGLMDRLPLIKDMKLLDLACGTGFFSHKIAEKIGPNGHLTAVDLSPGMLEQNRFNAQNKGLNNIKFVESDAISFLRQLKGNSIDGVVCGWGICYMDHAQFLREIERIIRPNGFIGIIENRANTLKDVSDLFRGVLMCNPSALVKNMVINLPKDHTYLTKTFCKGVFKLVHACDDGVVVPCSNGKDIAEYMIKSGASAGFLDALDKKKITSVMTEFIKAADKKFQKGQNVLVRHECCMLIATKA